MTPLAMEFALACVPSMVWQIDAAGTCVRYANAQWRAFAGVIASDPTQWADLVHPGDLAAWSQRATADAPRVYECRLRRLSENNYSWHKVSSYYMEDNGGSYLTVMTDIQQEKMLEHENAELRAREEIYSQLVANSCDPVITFEAERGCVVTINRAAERAFQYPATEVVGRSINTLLPQSYTTRGPQGALATCMRQALHGKFVSVGGSEPIYVTRRDGERVPVTLSVADFVISNTRIYVAILGITKDEIIKQEELKSSKDSFLRTMSHELRTPLFGLLGTLSTILEDSSNSISNSNSPSQGELLPADLSSGNPSITRSRPPSPFHGDAPSADNLIALRRDDASGLLAELGVRANDTLLQLDPMDSTPRSLNRRRNSVELRQMESCTRSLLSVVNNIITYYKIDMEVQPIGMPVQMRTLLNEVCGYFVGCVAQDVIFTYEVRDSVPTTIVSDANLLRHVLSNLVSNALRFTNKGNVTVVVDIVEPAAVVDDMQIWISVADTGIGIASEFFSQVFQPFSQMDNSNTRKYGGAGLGLAVCKRIVDLLGGTISFNSGLGLGTVFEIALPLSAGYKNNPESTPEITQHEHTNSEESEGYESSDLSHFSPIIEGELRTRNSGRYQSALTPIMEHETEDLQAKAVPRLPVADGVAYPARRMRTPDPSETLEDYPIPSLPPSHPVTATRKTSASAPASPRHHAVSHPSPVPSTSRFLRRPSFPFTLDDPSLVLMMGTPSGGNSSNSSIFNSPASSPRSAAQSPVSPPNTANSSFVFPLHMRVLVVDDNLVNQNVLKKMLKHLECIVTTAQHGQEALNILFEESFPKYVGYHNFDLILMDCQMPVMDGYGATKGVRNWEADKNQKPPIKIISLSASGSSETERQCYEAGSDGFIAKPVTLQGLFNVLSDRSLARPSS